MTEPLRVRYLLAHGALGLLFTVLGGITCAAEPLIESIAVVGNRRLTSDAFVFASGLKVGDAYDPSAVRGAFRRLWEKELFDDLRVEAADGEKGKILTFHIKERPVLVSVEYDNVRAITRANIEDVFKQRGLDLGIGKPMSAKNLAKAADYIRDLLGSKGYLDSTVTYSSRTTDHSESVHFNIRQGPRTRIKKIEFVGNEIFTDRQLRRALRQTRQSSLIAHMGGKDLWRPSVYDQDVQKIFELYRARGYLDVEIKPPVVEVRDRGANLSPKDQEKVERQKRQEQEKEERRKLKEQEKAERRKLKEAKRAERNARRGKIPSSQPGSSPPVVKEPKVRRSVYLTVKVKEGPQYKLGTMQVKGNTVFKDEEVLARFPLAPGAILNDSALQFGLERLRSDYGALGYIYATATKSVVREEGNIANVTIEVNEDRPYKVDRIEFEGNTVTRDSVLRREMRVNEGELLNRRRLDLSEYKIQQLGFVKPTPDPFIEPLEGTPLARLRIKLEELGRNEVQVGGGYSGLEGFFFSGSYSTRNFLGRGEIVSVFLQIGGRSDRYQISFREPWFLGKPYQFGFSIFRRDTQFAESQSRTGSGGSLLLGRQLGAFTQAQAVYSFEKVSFFDGTTSVASPTPTRTDTTIGSLTPSISFDRVDSPYKPTRGRVFSLSSQLAGRVFGGTNSFWKPLVQFTQYIPFVRRTFFAFHVEGGYILPFGEGAVGNPQDVIDPLTGSAAIDPSTGQPFEIDRSQILDIPRFERFFVGGDLLGPRIFETRSIGPIVYVSRDGSKITSDKDDIVRFRGRDVFGDPIQVFCDLRYDLTPSDGRCDSLAQERIGGNRFFLAQFEYAIPVAEPFVVALFVDAGNAYAESQSINFDDLRVSAGVEARIYLPVFGAPIRFILGKPIKKEPLDSTNAFQFSIGTSF